MAVEKRYQVFISSTFQDLQNARQEVSQALLRADCFPAGMELFPAADEEQFEFIKTVIDQSDYYIIISAGRYGSIHPETGLSYTEMEYEYAVETGKPVIRLLHKDPFNELKGAEIEKTAKGRKALEQFREKLRKSSLVGFWKNPRELMAETLFALQDVQKRKPAIGWVQSTSIATTEALLEIETLKTTVAELRLELAEIKRNSSDPEEIFQKIDGEFDVFLEKLTDGGNRGRKPTGETNKVASRSNGEICRRIVSAALSEIMEDKLFFEVMQSFGSQHADGYNFGYPIEMRKRFKSLLFLLESHGLFESKVIADGNSAVTEWHLSRVARRWASKVRAGIAT